MNLLSLLDTIVSVLASLASAGPAIGQDVTALVTDLETAWANIKAALSNFSPLTDEQAAQAQTAVANAQAVLPAGKKV